MSFGLYLHFPFCRSKCRYCDFFSLTDAVPHEAYARAIERECRLREPFWQGRLAQSLYLGGGTPTLWDAPFLRRAMDALRDQISFAPAAEWTIEANPGTVDAPRLSACREAGFNRLSIGVQSFDDALLSSMGRVHTAREAIQAAEAAREAGFESLSLDLIHGLPGQTRAGAMADLETALSLQPDHLSLYELMVDHLETETPLSRDVASGVVRLPDEETVFEMGRALAERASLAGFTRYEISNFARAGHDSRHNQLYWTGGEYLGLGCGAVGFALDDPGDPARGGRRWQNTRDMGRYLSALTRGELPEASGERLDGQTLFEEFVMLGLRRSAGVDLALARERFQVSRGRIEAIQSRALVLAREGLLQIDGTRMVATREGLDLHTSLALNLLR